MEKSVLRKEMKRLRREMTAEERKIRDEKIFENLTTLSLPYDKALSRPTDEAVRTERK